MSEIKYDLGEWTCPQCWDDVTLYQMQEINRLTKKNDEDFNVYKCLHIFCNKTKEEIDALPMPFFESICNRLLFVKAKFPHKEPKPYCEIDGQRYQVNLLEDLTVGEHMAIDTVLRTDDDNLATILAILCRKPDEKFDKEFQNKTLEERIKIFENAKAVDVMPVINFFLQCWVISREITLLHSEVQESIDHIINDIQSSSGSSASHLRSWKKRKILKKLKNLKKQI